MTGEGTDAGLCSARRFCVLSRRDALTRCQPNKFSRGGIGGWLWWRKGVHLLPPEAGDTTGRAWRRRLAIEEGACIPHSRKFHWNQAHDFHLFPRNSKMNFTSSGDSSHLGSSQREWDPKLKPISVHLLFKGVTPQSNLQASGAGRKPSAQGENSGKQNSETLISVAL